MAALILKIKTIRIDTLSQNQRNEKIDLLINDY